MKNGNFYLLSLIFSLSQIASPLSHANPREYPLLNDPAAKTLKQNNVRLSNDVQVLALLIQTRNNTTALALLSNKGTSKLNTFVTHECLDADYRIEGDAVLFNCIEATGPRSNVLNNTYKITLSLNPDDTVKPALKLQNSSKAPVIGLLLE